MYFCYEITITSLERATLGLRKYMSFPRSLIPNSLASYKSLQSIYLCKVISYQNYVINICNKGQTKWKWIGGTSTFFWRFGVVMLKWLFTHSPLSRAFYFSGAFCRVMRKSIWSYVACLKKITGSTPKFPSKSRYVLFTRFEFRSILSLIAFTSNLPSHGYFALYLSTSLHTIHFSYSPLSWAFYFSGAFCTVMWKSIWSYVACLKKIMGSTPKFPSKSMYLLLLGLSFDPFWA